ncbi:hypothetical protein PIB30_076634 [Stylosanthes scabra]|uniref:Uncharacterized protein n=1 Tax=Stylosanthes scabra TaxID=79078 RepID=A0ABU6RQP9_9FABA|nr:hypothetical protein [Stylosanthes scabra]
MNTTNLNYGWLSRKPRSHTLPNGRVGRLAPFRNLQIEWTACNGAPVPCPSQAHALDVDFVIKKRVVSPRHLGRTAARSTPIFIWTIIYRCEALDVSLPMALEPSHLDFCSSSYDQNSDRRSGLTALGEFLRTDLRMRIRHRIA